ncbi:GAF domain-containing sensor histidine kinase [Kineococcus rhizosphaerae]|uniref:histidine kinase n=1 Tax=Kineococcus rhizosphaerae TaxID=559628 RepID=A0A2T0RAK0_9ACTN|nr:GAF domain-containing sensor histidine kinase [Kineococcus rhizosphaerae]PRY18198.1 GAF domain-containing protein [Kineococcus rhizosphaerae]
MRDSGAREHLARLLPQPTPQPGALRSAAAAHGRTRRRTDERAAAAAATSVGARLTRVLGGVLALLLLVGLSGAGGLLVTGSSRARETQLRGLEAANAGLQLTLTDADTAVRDQHDRHDRHDTDRPRGTTTWTAAVAALPARRARVDALLTDPLQRSLFAEQSRLIDSWIALTDPDRGAADTAGAAAQAAAFAEVRDANERLDALVRHQRHDATTTENRVRYGALAFTVLTMAAALAVAVGAGRRTRCALVEPLRALVEVLDAQHGGRDGAQVQADPTRGPAEVRAVALAVNDLARENDLLLEAAGQSARLHRLAGDIGREVRDQLVAQDALQVAVTRLGEELGLARVWVRMLQPPGVQLSGHDAGLGPVAREWAASPLAPLTGAGAGVAADVSAAFDDSRAWLGQLHASGDVYAVPDTRPLTGRSPGLDAFLRGCDARALLLVPIGVGDSPHGLLTLVDAAGPREWTVQEVELVRSVAVDLARALVLAGLYRAQERLLGELRDVESVKSDLLATVSHELRTPLTSISGYLELLRDGAVGEVGEDVAAVLGIVERNTERLRALIEDLLLLSRVESAPTVAVPGETTVADLVTGVLAAVGSGSPAGHRGGGTVRCTTPPDELTGLRVHGDRDHLHRALLAVVDNAVKFSPAGSLVRLRVERHLRNVRIVVQDNGMGIPSTEVGAVFGRFARASNAALLQVPGTGLGLTIARDLVRLHGGGIDLDSEEGQGTTATLTLTLTDTSIDTSMDTSTDTPEDPGVGGARA